ncbi:MAG: hypothetical protein Q8Q06_04675 [bacterium]|nr:hypothetical protein [bacterium]
MQLSSQIKTRISAILNDGARDWFLVGVAISILPIAVIYRIWIVGVGAILGVFIGFFIAKKWTPDPRILGTPYLRRHDKVTTDEIHSSLISYLQSLPKNFTFLVVCLVVLVVLVTFIRYPHSLAVGPNDELLGFLVGVAGAAGATVSVLLGQFYYYAAKKLRGAD